MGHQDIATRPKHDMSLRRIHIVYYMAVLESLTVISRPLIVHSPTHSFIPTAGSTIHRHDGDGCELQRSEEGKGQGQDDEGEGEFQGEEKGNGDSEAKRTPSQAGPSPDSTNIPTRSTFGHAPTPAVQDGAAAIACQI